MPFVRLAYFPGASETVFASLHRALAEAPVPSSRLLFAAGPVPGGWQVVQVWDRKEALDEFNARWLAPALAGLGASGFPHPPVVTDFAAAEFSSSAG